MIKEMKHLSLPEVKKLIGKLDTENEEVKKYINTFAKLKTQDAKKLREELEKLDMLKLKEEHIVKIIDLLPEDKEDLNKIFTDMGLDENETNKILDITKQYK